MDWRLRAKRCTVFAASDHQTHEIQTGVDPDEGGRRRKGKKHRASRSPHPDGHLNRNSALLASWFARMALLVTGF
jgi:hypothetical protein